MVVYYDDFTLCGKITVRYSLDRLDLIAFFVTSKDLMIEQA